MPVFDPPDVSVDADPVVQLRINQQWLSFLIGFVSRGGGAWNWDVDQAQAADAITECIINLAQGTDILLTPDHFFARKTVLQSIPDNVFTPVLWSEGEGAGIFSQNLQNFQSVTIPEAGVYHIAYEISLQHGFHLNDDIQVKQVGGITSHETRINQARSIPRYAGAFVAQLGQGWVIDVRVRMQGGTVRDIQPPGQLESRWSIKRLSEIGQMTQ